MLPIKSLNHLFFLLKTNKKEIDRILSDMDKFYDPFKIPKKNKDGTYKIKMGKLEARNICPSKGRLKEIQNKIKVQILSKYEFQDHVQGGVKGKDNITNAKVHKGNKYFFVTDLKDFFPSISSNAVYKTFIQNGFSADVSSLITKLTTYRGNVPQGIPTSTYITNLTTLPIDFELLKLCVPYKIKYTRFVDDLSFSSKNNFQDMTLDILKIIMAKGMRISHRKTQYKIGPTEITGIEVRNNIMKANKEVRMKFEKTNDDKSKQGLGIYINRIKNA